MTNKIEKLRKKFILITSISFFIVMLLMGGMMFLINLLATRNEIHEVMDYIVENDGELSLRRKWQTENNDALEGSTVASVTETDTTAYTESADSKNQLEQQLDTLKKLFGVGSLYESEEFPYATRYFAVLFDEDMNVEDVKTSHIASVQQEEAEEYAALALQQPLQFGSFGNYYYQVAERVNGNGTIVVYLESLRQMDATNRLLYTALMLIGLGSIVTLFLVRMLSFQMVKKELQSMEMQDRFITNASHELKTPLAVIKANTEVEQMLNGENEWNQSTMRQVERLTGLIQNLIRIVRAEEKENAGPLQNLNVSDIVKETADTFETVANQDGKQLSCTIEPSLQLMMREVDIRQLTSLLLDNAIKYCDEAGMIQVLLKGRGRTLRLTVSNSYAEGENTDYSRFFERFYRKDESHNVEKGGYGIGLSIAENIVKKYKGSIDVDWKNGIISFNCVLYTLPKRVGERHKMSPGE